MPTGRHPQPQFPHRDKMKPQIHQIQMSYIQNKMLSEQWYPVSPTQHHRDFSRLHVLMATFKSPVGKNLSSLSTSLNTHVYRKGSQTASVQTTSLFVDLQRLFYQKHPRYFDYYCMDGYLVIPTIQKACNSVWVQVLAHMHMCVHAHGG